MEARPPRVMIVDDDALVRSLVRQTCEAEGYEVVEVARSVDAVTVATDSRPDIVLLDLMMPGQGGFDTFRELRRAGHRMPVVILSARGDEIDVVLGLEIGADDYIQKPFRPRELIARLAAHLRKAQQGPEGDDDQRQMVFRDLVVDPASRRVVRRGEELAVTHTEFDLLAFLARHAGEVVSRERILSSVWGYGNIIATRVIDVHVRNLRRKIETDPSQPRYILAVPGVGYRFTNTRPESGR